MNNLIIPDSVYPYLRVQKGEINHIEDRGEFEAAYNKGLQELLDVMLPHIPRDMKRSLDVGSGMGGIDILLQKHFKHHPFLMDAEETPPVCIKHDIPFNSYKITTEFFVANDASLAGYGCVDDLDKIPTKYNFDLIFSVGSYCFHYSPEIYLQFVRQVSHKDTVLIFDVRNRHTDWLEILRENFTEVAVLVESDKFTKRVFKIK